MGASSKALRKHQSADRILLPLSQENLERRKQEKERRRRHQNRKLRWHIAIRESPALYGGERRIGGCEEHKSNQVAQAEHNVRAVTAQSPHCQRLSNDSSTG